MICIVCKSEFLSSQIKKICETHLNEIINETSFPELLKTLSEKKVRLVFFDSEFFIDSAKYRKVSPETRFIVIARAGFEEKAAEAIRCGASDFILCPFFESGVLNCL
ncbi:hypothetical protein [Treponema pedis]|uniref:Response regulatory domain-containing protein n=3 Tax=Treponema pedis TaxID=409322 RepID=S6A108_9SPIR|nr:hypothetical protein [Treponema pedis]AGT44448.1 hypothetical protein TPE_1974 [Treponema pedis str. T A4]QOW59766.1 hypothetical protein IFE08_07730 [Treponema pedis]QSI05137.1 hypothetical protein DYQ05_09540 [Treponema pedis]